MNQQVQDNIHPNSGEGGPSLLHYNPEDNSETLHSHLVRLFLRYGENHACRPPRFHLSLLSVKQIPPPRFHPSIPNPGANPQVRKSKSNPDAFDKIPKHPQYSGQVKGVLPLQA